jgi:DNA polymerase/3'-5' exonuclease PolX
MAVAKIDNTFRHLDIFYYPKEVFPFSLLFTTGSKEFNITIRSHANKKGYSLNEKNLSKLNGQLVTENEYKFKIGKNIPENEEDIFLFLGFTYVDPINR